MRRRCCRPALVVVLVLLATLTTSATLSVQTQPGPAERLFAARHSSISRTGIVYDLTSGTAVEFARVRTNGNTGALAASPDGRLFVVTDADGGALWEVTTGGDLTRAEPRARGLFSRTLGQADSVRGLTLDADGTAYVLYRQSGNASPVVRVSPEGIVTELPLQLEDPRSLLVHEGRLYLTDYHTGEVVTAQLDGSAPQVFATGFARSHAQGVREVQIPSSPRAPMAGCSCSGQRCSQPPSRRSAVTRRRCTTSRQAATSPI